MIDPCCVTVSGPLWRRCAGARCAPTPGIHSLYKSNLIRKFNHNYSYLSLLIFSPPPGSFRFSAAASAGTGTGPRPLTTRVWSTSTPTSSRGPQTLRLTASLSEPGAGHAAIFSRDITWRNAEYCHQLTSCTHNTQSSTHIQGLIFSWTLGRQ